MHNQENGALKRRLYYPFFVLSLFLGAVAVGRVCGSVLWSEDKVLAILLRLGLVGLSLGAILSVVHVATMWRSIERLPAPTSGSLFASVAGAACSIYLLLDGVS